ncbi:MAG: alginate export family protein [Phycisphaerales bacterium]
MSPHPRAKTIMRSRARWALVCASLATTPCLRTACAQGDIERRVESRLRRADTARQLDVQQTLSLSERTNVDIGGFYNFTFLTLQDSQGNSRGLIQNDTTLFARASIDGVHTFFGRLRFRHQDFTPGDSFDGRGDQWREPILDRYWYELNARDLFASARADSAAEQTGSGLDFNLRLGRQFVDWGSGLALSEVLLAARATLVVGDRLTIEGLAGVTPPDESIIDFDTSRAAYNRDTKRGFFGALVRGQTNWGNVYGSILWSVDYNNDSEPRLPIGPVEFDYSPVYIGLGLNASLSNNWLLETEVVFEGGHSKSDPLRGLQTSESIRALAARGELTYLLRDARQSRAQIEVLFATGDSDRLTPSDTVGGNLSGSDDNGFNSLGFANTGLAFGTTFSNLMAVRGGVSTFPLRAHRALSQLQVGADVFVFGKLDSGAPIDEPTRAGRSFLGVETDLYVNYRVTSDLGINLRYGAFFPGSAIGDGAGDGERDTRHFFLIGVTLAF